MALYSTKAIVLRNIDFSETDKLVTFMTEKHGKIKGVAKAARKIKSRFGAALEPMTHIQLIYFGKSNQELFKLNNCDIIQSFQPIRDNLDKLYTGIYFTELIDTLLKESDHSEDLYQLLLQSLRRLQDQNDTEILRWLFEIRIIALLGYTPRLTHCMLCKQEPVSKWIGFSYPRGGIICSPCMRQGKPEVTFSAGTLNYLKKLLVLDINHSNRLKIPKEIEKEVENITHRLVLSHAGRELKSYPFIKEMAAL